MDSVELVFTYDDWHVIGKALNLDELTVDRILGDHLSNDSPSWTRRKPTENGLSNEFFVCDLPASNIIGCSEAPIAHNVLYGMSAKNKVITNKNVNPKCIKSIRNSFRPSAINPRWFALNITLSTPSKQIRKTPITSKNLLAPERSTGRIYHALSYNW